MTETQFNPDDKPVYDALREAGTGEALAYTAIQRIRDMAAANLIAQLLSKFDTQTASLEALKDQMKRERAMLWALIGILGAAVGGGLVALVVQILK